MLVGCGKIYQSHGSYGIPTFFKKKIPVNPNLLIHVNGRPGGSLEKAAVKKKRSGILRNKGMKSQRIEFQVRNVILFYV